MSIKVYSPFSFLRDVQQDLDNLNRNVATSTEARQWSPAVDIAEDDKGYYLTADLPGISADTVEVSSHKGVLTISGERSLGALVDKSSVDKTEERRSVRSERWQGKFERRFTLPESANVEAIEAKYDNGVLAIYLPRLASAGPRKVTVQ